RPRLSSTSAARGCASASASIRTRATWRPCLTACRCWRRSTDLLGGGRAVERQYDSEAPGAVLRLRAVGKVELADGDADDPLRLAVRCNERQQQALAIAGAVPCVVEPAEHHAQGRCLDAGAKVGEHPGAGFGRE